MSGALAAIVALLSRFVSTIAELLCVSIAYVSGGRPPRALKPAHEQIVADEPDSTGNAGTGSNTSISDATAEAPSASAPLEEQIVGE